MSEQDKAIIEAFDDLSFVSMPHVRPPGLDAVRTTIRRRRRFQQVGGAACAIALLLVGSSLLIGTRTRPAVHANAGPVPVRVTAAAPAKVVLCPMTILPVPAGMDVQNVWAGSIDPTGKYILGSSSVGHDADPNQDFQPILWTDGTPQVLPIHGKRLGVSTVNSSGVAVGLNDDPSDRYVFRYQNGTVTRLQTPPGSWNLFPAPVINAGGDVVINAEPLAEQGSISEHIIVLLWKGGSTTPITLPLPAGASAVAITDDGTIIGGTGKDGRADAVYAWDQQGGGRKLQVPAGMHGSVLAARGQWATGGLFSSNYDQSTVALWNLKTGTLTQLGAQGVGDAVNAAGWVKVSDSDGTVLRPDGVRVELAVPRGQTAHAQGISDTGIVVGVTVIKPDSLGDDKGMGPHLWQC
jgi:uncharacterized membrane protein